MTEPFELVEVDGGTYGVRVDGGHLIRFPDGQMASDVLAAVRGAYERGRRDAMAELRQKIGAAAA